MDPDFVLARGVRARELWRSDGTAAGTWRVRDIYPGSGGSYPAFQRGRFLCGLNSFQ